ncbi:MAG: lipopolysaccharide biosynthesis protein, partial [Oscillospiraceae bacterium]|nr:lipopolysaccharide biosynthesis protein [Oscillospiraceae bacterium]
KKGIGIVALVATVNLGVYAMALSLLAVALISQVINAWPNQKLLGYAYPQQFLDMLPAMVLTLVMGACVYPISFLQLSDWIVLPLQVLAGVAVYVLLSALFKVDSFQYMLGIIKRIKER